MTLPAAPHAVPTRQVRRAWMRWARDHPLTADTLAAFPVGLAPEAQLLTSALLEPGRWTRLVLSFDVGVLAAGWLRDQEFDRCWHLSVSHPTEYALVAPSELEMFAWAKLLWGQQAARLCWVEESRLEDSDPYRRPGVVHLRLFVSGEDEARAPEGVLTPLRPWGAEVLQVIGAAR